MLRGSKITIYESGFGTPTLRLRHAQKPRAHSLQTQTHLCGQIPASLTSVLRTTPGPLCPQRIPFCPHGWSHVSSENTIPSSRMVPICLIFPPSLNQYHLVSCQLTRRSVLRMIQCSTPPELPSCPLVPRVLHLPLVAASRYTAQSHRLSVCSSLFRMSNAQPLSIHMCCALCIAHAVFHYEYFKHRCTLHHLSFGVRPGLEH